MVGNPPPDQADRAEWRPTGYCGLLVVDICSYGHPARDEVVRAHILKAMYRIVSTALDAAGIPAEARHIADRGDGVIVIVPGLRLESLLSPFAEYLNAGLRRHNRLSSEVARLCLRVSLHAGRIDAVETGLGDAVILARRLNDAAEFKRALAESGAQLGVIASDHVYESVIRHGRGLIDPGDYRRVRVQEKETRAWGWLRLLGLPRPRPRPPARTPRFARPVPASARAAAAALVAPLLALLMISDSTGSALALCRPPVQLNVAVAAMAAPVVSHLALAFSTSWREPGGCRRVSVRVDPAPSPDFVINGLAQGWGAAELATGMPEPHAYLPLSGTELPETVGAAEPVSLSPVAMTALVLLTTRSVAEERGWRDGTFRWQDLIEAMSPEPGAAPGLVVARPPPVASDTGLAAAVALYRSALGVRTLGGATLRRADAGARLRALERSTVLTRGGAEDEPLCELARLFTGKRAHRPVAALVTEKLAQDHRLAGPRGPQCAGRRPGAWPGDLVALYPAEGTILLSLSYLRIRYPDRPRPHGLDQAAEAFYRFLRGGEAQRALRLAGYRDAGGSLDPLTPAVRTRPARLPEPGLVEVETVLAAWEDARRPVRVMLAVDASVSMDEPLDGVQPSRLDAARDLAGRLVRLLGEADQIGVWSLAHDEERDADHLELVPLAEGAYHPVARTPRSAAVEAALEGLRATGTDAPLPGILEVAAARVAGGGPGAATRRAVIVLTDGTARISAGTGPARTLTRLTALGDRAPAVLVVSFGPGTGACGSAPVREIVEVSGGGCVAVRRTGEIDRAVDAVSAVLWGDAR